MKCFNDSFRALGRHAVPWSSVGAIAAFLLLVLYVVADSLNHTPFAALMAERGFPDWKGPGVMRTARILVLFGGFAAVAGGGGVLFCRALRRPHRAFLLCACLLCPVYMFLFTPFSVPDEPFHYQQALIRAAEWTGTEYLDKTFLLDEFALNRHEQSTHGYLVLSHPFSGHNPVGETFAPSELELSGNALQHVFQSLGLALGLELGAPPVACFYLGRVFAVLFYILGVALAVRLAPVMKECLAFVALTPMALQQACSFSYDTELLFCCFLGFGLFLEMVWGEGKKVSAAELAGACAITFFGMAVKCSVLPFLPLLLAVPASRFRGGLRGKMLFGALLLLLSVAAAASSVQALTFGALSDGKPAWTLCDLLVHPLRLAHVLLNTADREAVSLVFCTFGSNMSGYTLTLPVFHPVLVGVLFVISARLETQPVPPSVRVAAAAGFLLSSAYTVVAMLTTWTSVDMIRVVGLQGRYWTPLMPLLACVVLARSSGGDGPRVPAPDSAGRGRLLFPALLAMHFSVIVFVAKFSVRGF